MNNMKQRLTGKILSMLFLLFAIGWTVNSSAQGASAQGVTFSTQDNGDGNKTLIVKAWGDLADYKAQVATQKKWNKSAEKNVYNYVNNKYQTVYENEVIDDRSYYTATKDFTLLLDGAPENGDYFYNVASTDSWDFSKSSGKHVYKVYPSYDNTIHRSNEEEVSSSTTSFDKSSTFTYNGNTYSIYILSANEIAKDAAVDPSSVTLITLEDLNNYLLSTIVYTPVYNKDIYRSRNDGAKEPLTAGQQQTYEPGDKFWTATNEYHAIENFNDFLAEHKDYYTQNYETRNFVDIVALNLVSNGCTSIKFVQDEDHADNPIKMGISQFASILNSHPDGTYTYPLTTNKASIVDFSEVNIPASDFNSFSFSGQDGPSFILPDNLTDDESKQIASTIGYINGNIYWFSEKNQEGKYTALNVQIKNDAKFVSAATAKKDRESVKSVVLYGSLYKDTPLSYFDIAGIDNLVLSNIDQKGSLDVFKNFKNVKRIILKNEQNLAQYDELANTKGCSVEVVQTITAMQSGVECNEDGKDNVNGVTINLLKIHALKPGALANMTHYYDPTYSEALWYEVSGKFNNEDLKFFNNVDTKRLNLSQVEFADDVTDKETALNAIVNDKLEYLALPDLGINPSDPLFTTLFKNNSKNLKAVCQYNSKDTKFTSYSKVQGSLPILTSMINKGSEKGIKNQMRKVKLSGKLNARDITTGAQTFDENGHFVWDKDPDPLCSNTSGGKDDPRKLVGTSQMGAFGHGQDYVDLKDAEFDKITDMTLSYTSLLTNDVKEVIIPSSATELPADFMDLNGNNIEKICIPRNIKKIGLRAFQNLTRLNKVTTTDKDGNEIDYGFSNYVKYSVETVDKVTNTTTKDQQETDIPNDPNSGSIVFSDALEEIDSWAFNCVERIKDVYNLATKAPKCHINAFGSNPCTGNNGFSPIGGITRSDFNIHQTNGYIDKWIVMLHYPTSIQGTDLEKRYKDITRDYTISDAEGHTDGQGNLLCWPNQSEFNRSYTQGTNGYLWDAWETDRTEWSNLGSYALAHSSKNTGYQVEQDKANEWYEECKNLDKQDAIFYHTGYETDGKSVVRITDDTKDVDQGAWQKVTYSDPDKADKQLYDGDYRGWHQFVLCATSRAKDEKPGHNFRFINDNGWWTICVPFDMTKAEVSKMFGIGGKHGGPHVCEFTGVERTNPDADQKNGSILLKFDRDVYNNVYKKDADNKNTLEVERKTNDDDIVIHAGVPYMLQPDFDVKDDGTLRTPFAPGDQIFRSEKCKAKTSLELRSLARKNFVDVLALDKDGNPAKDAKSNDYHYYFIGNFWQTEMPQYAYFLAWYYPTAEQVKEGFSPNGFATYFWQKEMPAQTLNWNAFTAIIGSQWSTDDRKFFVPDGKLGNIHWYTRKGNDANGGSVFADDSFNTSTSAKRGNSPENVSFSFGGDNTADGITKVHFGDQTLDVYNGKVYNLNGQYVGDSLENLPKGIYIAGGKKYVVK